MPTGKRIECFQICTMEASKIQFISKIGKIVFIIIVKLLIASFRRMMQFTKFCL